MIPAGKGQTDGPAEGAVPELSLFQLPRSGTTDITETFAETGFQHDFSF